MPEALLFRPLLLREVMTDAAPILGREITYNYQVPLSDHVRRHAEIMTMAVGLSRFCNRGRPI